MIKSLSIARFKSVSNLNIELGGLNVLVGGNNSGKSSVLQALHFSVSLAQSRKLIGSPSFNFTIAPQQILYTPIADVTSLGPGRNLTQAKEKEIRVGVITEDAKNADVSVRRGKNRNLNVQIQGDAEVIAKLESLTNPFTVYVPGLAGLAKTESLVSQGVLARAIARGDANLVLRNVLRELSRDEQKWQSFTEAIQAVFPETQIEITYEQTTDEFIDVEIASGNFSLPIDAAGTGFLQTAQILSYIFLFNPVVTLLDEPDSHLHPNNQRALARLLMTLSAEQKTQVIVATHSRHILDELRETANLIWMRAGEAQTKLVHLDVLVDLGALDSAEGLITKGIKYVVLTEDADRKPMKQLLATLVPDGEVQVWSYKGCTNIQTASALGAFIKEVSPQTKVVVHRDSDYLEGDQLQDLKTQYNKVGISMFFTPGVDIESAFCKVEHLKAVNLPHASQLEQLHAEALISATDLLRQQALDGSIKNEDMRHKYKYPTRGQAALVAWSAQLDVSEERWMKGKVFLPILRKKFQDLYQQNLRVFEASEFIKLPELSQSLGISPAQQPSGPANVEQVVSPQETSVAASETSI